MCAVKWILTSLPKLACCRSSYTGAICLPFSFSRWPACLATSPCLPPVSSVATPRRSFLPPPHTHLNPPHPVTYCPGHSILCIFPCNVDNRWHVSKSVCVHERGREWKREKRIHSCGTLGSRVRRKRRGGSLLEGVCVCVWAGIYAVILWLRCGNKSNPFALLDTSFGKLGRPSVGRIRES